MTDKQLYVSAIGIGVACQLLQPNFKRAALATVVLVGVLVVSSK